MYKEKFPEWKFNEGQSFQLYGRIKYKRHIGSILFLKIVYKNQIIQIIVDKTLIEIAKQFKLSDIISCKGIMAYSSTKEQSLLAQEIKLEQACLYKPTDKVTTVIDPNILNVYRGIKLAEDNTFYTTLLLRSKLLQFIRNFFIRHGFLQLDMPCLRPYYGGALAKPFTTYLNERKDMLYLSIAPQLDLKEIVSGGIPQVFTITHNFRNEGIDSTHHPEFAVVEAYEVFADYKTMMNYGNLLINKFLEDNNICLQYNNRELSKQWTTVTYDELVQPYKKYTIEQLQEKYTYLQQISDYEEALYTVFDKEIQKTLINPTNVIDFPVFSATLAKTCPTKHNRVQQCQQYIMGVQIANIYSEETDPLALEAKFLKGGMYNELFISKMKFGMPPCGGYGLGIDRLLMLITNKRINNVLPFVLYG